MFAPVFMDNPPLLTALAVGNVTITAGTAACDVTVSAATLPLGTVIWSNPGDGSGVTSIVPAVPSTTGVADVFAFQADGTVQAIAADGTTAWTADISQAQAFAGGTYDMSQGTLLPDFQGGLVVMNNDGSIYKLDGITGQAYPSYTPPGPGCSVYCELPTGGLAVHPDGTIFTSYTDENGYNVVGIDPTTGTQKFMVPATFNGVEPFQGGSTTIIIAGDGYAYYSYPYLDSVYEYPATCRLGVLRVSSSGDAESIPVFSATCGGWIGGIGHSYLTGANMITNADQGILLTWQTPNPDGSGYTSQMATITGGAAATAVEPWVPSEAGSAVVPVLQAQDGSFVRTFWDSSGDYDDMVAFDAAGNVRWIVPNETPQIATADGGVIGQSGITYDQYGNATGVTVSSPTYSWFGNSYQIGSVEQILTNVVNLARSFWPFAGGNASRNGTAIRPVTQDVQQLIAQIAADFVGSTQWLDQEGDNKCNLFVQNVLNDAGAQAPLSLGTRVRYYFHSVNTASYPASAGDWAFPHPTLACWHAVAPFASVFGIMLPPDVSVPGDVIAEGINYSDASGHVGIIVGPRQTASADSAAPCISFPPNVFPNLPPNSPAGTIDISDWGFRPDGWVDPYSYPPTGQPCRDTGLEKDVVVKRFACQ